MPKLRFIQQEINDTSINCAVSGKGKNLVLIHGWTNNWEGWIPLANHLKKNYRLYIIDLPGFGDSGMLNRYSIADEAEYVAIFLKKRRIHAKAVIGLSMGSLVAAQLGKEHPELMESVILIGAVFRLNEGSMKNLILSKALPLIKKSERASYIVKRLVETKRWGYLTAKYLNMYNFNSLLIDSYGFIGRKKMRKEAFIEMGISISKFSLSNVLDNYTVPVFLLYGKNDKFISLKEAKAALAGKKGNYSFGSVREAGHIVSLEKPGPVAIKIKSFLGNRIKNNNH